MTRPTREFSDKIDQIIDSSGAPTPARLRAAVHAHGAFVEAWDSGAPEKELRVRLHALFSAIEDCYATPAGEQFETTEFVKKMADKWVADAERYKRMLDQGKF